MKAGAVRKLSGAELRAMRDQRAAADPAAEAWAHESSFLRSLATAEEDFDWIIANEAWVHLGHDTFSAWWEARAPRMHALGFQPTKQIALAVLTRLRSDDEKLPKAQRRTNRQLAASVGLPETTMRRVAPRSLPAPNGAGADLGQPADATPAVSCEKCDGPVKPTDVQGGHLRCRACDPSSLHRAVVVDDEFTDACTECVNEAATAARLAAANPETSAAVPAGNTEDASPALGEPDVDVEAASTSGTETAADAIGTAADAGDPSSTSVPAAPAGESVPGSPSGVSQELQDGIEEGIGCDRCDFSLLVSSVDPDASLTEMRYHLRREHDLYGDAAGLALARVRTISPAADLDDASQGVLQQPGPDSPTGREAVQPHDGRSEFDHHASAGVSDSGVAPAIAVEPVLEGGGLAPDPSSSSDPVVLRASVEDMIGVVERLEVPREDWNAMTPAQRRAYVHDFGSEVMNGQGGYGASIESGAPDSDLEEPWESPAEVVVRLFKTFTEELDAVDYEAVGPELTDVDLYAIRLCDGRIAEHLERLEKFVRNP